MVDDSFYKDMIDRYERLFTKQTESNAEIIATLKSIDKRFEEALNKYGKFDDNMNRLMEKIIGIERPIEIIGVAIITILAGTLVPITLRYLNII